MILRFFATGAYCVYYFLFTAVAVERTHSLKNYFLLFSLEFISTGTSQVFVRCLAFLILTCDHLSHRICLCRLVKDSLAIGFRTQKEKHLYLTCSAFYLLPEVRFFQKYRCVLFLTERTGLDGPEDESASRITDLGVEDVVVTVLSFGYAIALGTSHRVHVLTC